MAIFHSYVELPEDKIHVFQPQNRFEARPRWARNGRPTGAEEEERHRLKRLEELEKELPSNWQDVSRRGDTLESDETWCYGDFMAF